MERTLAKRYAAALLRVTDPEGSTEEVEALLLAIQKIYRSDRGFRSLLASPKIPRAVKKKILRHALQGHAKPSFLDFMDLLVDKNRLAILPELADMFDRLADATHGLVRIKVRSWRALSDAHRSSLSEKITRMTGRKILIEAETDAALKGGMLVQIGDSVIDGSVAHRLKGLAERFRELQRR